jgi:hypothetical protein
MNIETQILQALARGYCTPENSRKVFDPDLIIAMTKEVVMLFSRQLHNGEIQVSCPRR